MGQHESNDHGELRACLSFEAAVFTPTDPEFSKLTTRWQDYAAPSVQAVVQVATEADLSRTIRHANRHSIPFFASSGGHAASYALGDLKEGIQISTDKMNRIEIHGDSATIHCGVKTFEVIGRLWAAGKQTVNGCCEATGLIGPMLGGGHGLLQGRYGLIADQLISARVVLADGEIVEVSATVNPDLFWAIKGAGHNFGLVSEVVMRIYDVGESGTWAYETMMFGRDAMESIIDRVYELSKDQPAGLMTYIVMLPNSDPAKAGFMLGLYHNGPVSELDAIWETFRKVADPVPGTIVKGTANYNEMGPLLDSGKDQPISVPAAQRRLRFPIDLNDCRASAYGEVFDMLNSAVTQNPKLKQSTVLIKGHANKAVEAMSVDSSAVPVRKWGIRNVVVMMYDNDKSLDGKAIQLGKDMRLKLQAGSSNPAQLRAYVNYALGDEDLESLYGYDSWRLPKLLALKKRYDPHNRFRWYNPLVR